MATFGLSLHCQLGGKVLFDRICSVPVHSTLGQIYKDNIENVEVAEGVRLRKIKVGETKAGTATGSEIAEKKKKKKKSFPDRPTQF